MANFLFRLMFRIQLNDTTNAFKAYRTHGDRGLPPLILAAFQSHGRTAAEGHRARIFLDRDADHLAKPPHRQPSSSSRRWAAVIFSSACTSGWRSISAGGLQKARTTRNYHLRAFAQLPTDPRRITSCTFSLAARLRIRWLSRRPSSTRGKRSQGFRSGDLVRRGG